MPKSKKRIIKKEKRKTFKKWMGGRPPPSKVTSAKSHSKMGKPSLMGKPSIKDSISNMDPFGNVYTPSLIDPRIIQTLTDLNKSIKTIVLIGDIHVHKMHKTLYKDTLTKQQIVIDNVIGKFGRDKTYLYSEAPENARKLVMSDNTYSSSVIVKNYSNVIPIKLSNIDACKRIQIGSCNEEFTDDILSIFGNQQINCVIAILGLLHVSEIQQLIQTKRTDIIVVIVNVVPESILNSYQPF
jgi:hypothetical protein